jgi:hypothetical protein
VPNQIQTSRRKTTACGSGEYYKNGENFTIKTLTCGSYIQNEEKPAPNRPWIFYINALIVTG